MKTKFPATLALVLVAGTLLARGQNQSVLDLLRSIQPGAPPPATQPAPATAPAPAPTPAPAASATPPAGPAPVLDTKPAFMSILTNSVRVTNIVIVTNLVVVTNFTYTTNYFNAQGQLLMPLQPVAAPALAVADAKTNPLAAAAPDPAVIRSNRLQALRDLLLQGVTAASNQLSPAGSFANNPTYQIRIPEGVTVFDRKKGQTLTTALNTAAEKAIPSTCALLQQTVAKLDAPDPAALLKGDTDAATKFLLSAEGQNLANQILGIVQGTAAEARVSEAYNAVMLRGGGLLGAVLGTAPSVDMNAHITRGVMQAVFQNLSSRENVIRTDPSARKTKALQDAFAK